jgi:hypothetical protein
MTPEEIRNISEKVYRARLLRDGGGCKPDNVERMIAKDGDGGVKLRGRAAIYDDLARDIRKVIGK